MNGLSLFSGIGGLDLGLERAGITTVGQVEIDPWCRRVLAKHWPDVPRHDDVRTAADWWLSEERPTVDLVFGGFPCQDISSAGRKVGIGGERSGLWSELHNIVRLLRPRWVLLENVADIVVRGLDVVLADLASIGYDAEWDCLPAASIGAPHIRDRWFAVAYPGSEGGRERSGREQLPAGSEAAGDVADSDEAGRWDVAQLPGRRESVRPSGPVRADADRRSPRLLADPSVSGRGQLQPHTAEVRPGQAESRRRGGPRRIFERPVDRGWPAEPGMDRLVDGIPARLVRPQLHGYGNAVVPQVAEHIGRLIVATDRAGRAA